MSYTVKYLSDSEFDMLPFRYAKESFGAANRKTKTAYVRRSGVKALDTFVTDHELDELVNKYSEHEDVDGIRYKKGKDIFRSVGPALLGVITGGLGIPAIIGGTLGAGLGFGLGKGKPVERLPGALMGGLGGYGGATMGAGAVKGFQGAGKGFMSKLGGTLKGALGFGGTTGTAPQTFQAAGKTLPTPEAVVGSLPTLKGTFAASQGLAGGLGTAATAGAGPLTQAYIQSRQAATPAGILGFGGGGGAGTTGPAPSPTPSAPTPTPTQEPTLWDKLTKLGLGGVAERLGPQPQTFDPMQQSQLVKDVLARVRQGATAQIGPEQREALSFEFDQAKEETLKAMRERFKALRPGSDIATDSQFRELAAEIESDFEERKARAIAGAQINLGIQQTEQLSQLANLDVFTLAQQAAVSVEEARQFKELIANLLGTGTAQPANQGININLGGQGLSGSVSRLFQ